MAEYYIGTSGWHYEHWRESSSRGFVFAVKVSRFITHTRRLGNVEEPMQSFLARLLCLQGVHPHPVLYRQ